jgi:hypothetical protein
MGARRIAEGAPAVRFGSRLCENASALKIWGMTVLLVGHIRTRRARLVLSEDLDAKIFYSFFC